MKIRLIAAVAALTCLGALLLTGQTVWAAAFVIGYVVSLFFRDWGEHRARERSWVNAGGESYRVRSENR